MEDTGAPDRSTIRRPARWLIVALVVVSAVAILVALLHSALLGFGLRTGATAFGYNLSYASLSSDARRLDIAGLKVSSKGGEPVLSADRVTVAYDLRKVFGSAHPFGLTDVDIERPTLTYIKHRDGSSNITLPAGNANAGSSGPIVIPQVRVALHDGTVGIEDDTRIFAHSRRIAVKKLRVDAKLAPDSVSKIALGLTLQDADGSFPITGRGTLDPKRGLELSRISAHAIGLSALIDYALNSPALHVANGVLEDVDARIYGLRGRSGQMDRHIAVRANLDHFQPYLNGIAKPLRDGRGVLQIYDRGLAIPRVDGSIAGVPVRIAGGIYNLASPALRLGITGNGDLSRLVTLSDAAKKFPIVGPIAFQLFVEGAATQPMTVASFTSPHLTYARVPVQDASGAVVLHGEETAILRSALAYDGIVAGARGVLTLGKHTGVDLLADVTAAARRVPYAVDLLGDMRVDASANVRGTDSKLETTGVVVGDTQSTQLAGTFAVDENGVGDIGPFTIDGPGNRAIYARVALDRPRGGGGAAFVALRGVRLATGGREPSLPGLTLTAVPRVSGALEGALAIAFAGKRVFGGGDLHASRVRALGYPIDDLTARFSADGNTAHPQDARVAADLRYRGAIAPLVHAANPALAATGAVDIPITVIAHGSSNVLAQIHDARFTRVSIGGVALHGIAATVGVRGKAIDVYGVRADVDGGNVVAQGSFGNGGRLQVSSSGIDLHTLRSTGLPIAGGAVALFATVAGTAQSPRVSGGVAASDVTLSNPQFAGVTVNANTGLSYDDGRLGISNALIDAGPAVATFDGTIAGLRGNPRNATYAFDAHLRQADISTLAHLAHASAQYPQGTLDANVRVAGSGSAPQIAGNVAVPEGSINGLRFRDASVALVGSAKNVAARDGHVTVGTSLLGFSGNVSAAAQTIALHAPRVDLDDFNDYFDPGDLLGGTGSIDIAASNAPNHVATQGRIRLEHVRLKHFELGRTTADWSTHGRVIQTALALGERSGQVTESGNVTLAQTAPLRDALHRSGLAIAAHARRVDLSIWLPAAGIQVPVAGFVDADASVRGTYPKLVAQAHAGVGGGHFQRLAIRTATLDARAENGMATISNAALAIDNLNASASGTAALRQNGPFALRMTASTPDVAALTKTVSGKSFDGAGAITTTATVSGTPKHIAINDTFDATNVRYMTYTVPRAHAQIAVSPERASLQNTEIDLQKGRVLIDGFAPLRPNYAGIAPASPVALDITADKIDLAQFAVLAPKGTLVAGFLDGRVGLVGNLTHPGLSGALALTDGSFVGPQEKSKISALNMQLAFADRTITLQNARATVGGGSIAANGAVSVPDLRSPAQSASIALHLASNYAVFDLPNLFRGRLNGNVDVARAAGADYMVNGSVAVSSARISTAGLLPKAPATESSAAPLPVDLNLAVEVGNDVRVQGGPVDIGAKGDLKVAGTVAAPTVDGVLTSTGGTLSFYRTFRMQYPSTVSFAPSDGVIPTIDATATTTVDSPQTDVTLHVTGAATQLNVDLASDPAYSREQILGLLVGAQALGAVSGVASTTQTGAQANPFQSLAEGQLGNLLTQNILEPFSSQLGSAVGLNNLEVNYQPGGSLGLGAQKQIAKNVNAVFAQSFNYPPRQTIGIRATPRPTTAIQFTLFSQPQSNKYEVFQPGQVTSTNNAVTASQPATGTNGYSFSLQRKF